MCVSLCAAPRIRATLTRSTTAIWPTHPKQRGAVCNMISAFRIAIAAVAARIVVAHNMHLSFSHALNTRSRAHAPRDLDDTISRRALCDTVPDIVGVFINECMLDTGVRAYFIALANLDVTHATHELSPMALIAMRGASLDVRSFVSCRHSIK